MPKLKTFYVCQNCSHTVSQWVGQCPGCGQWNSFIEEIEQADSPSSKAAAFVSKGIGTASSSVATSNKASKQSRVYDLKRLSSIYTNPPARLSSGIEEFDRVLGGGFVPGQVILLGGEPGVGKSTLLTEIAKSIHEKNILYVCGEESMEQIKLRTSRMGYDPSNLLMLPETDVDVICSVVQATKDLSLVIVDSIQTVYSSDLPGISGSMTQVRGCAQLLTMTAKATGVPIIMIGHVTKEGVVAGPKVLEHTVDTVLVLEGDSQHMYRMLRTDKNRFGPVSEVGIFEMTEKSLTQVMNPSELFLGQMLSGTPGSCVTVVMEGQRPLLFEVQALTIKTTFGYPRRTASGFNVNRLQVLIATLEKRSGLDLSSYDVYLNVAGGFKISENSADLAVCIAIASSIKNMGVKPKLVAFGECGLNGEIRKVPNQEKRSKEAKKLGFTKIISADSCRLITEAVAASLGK